MMNEERDILVHEDYSRNALEDFWKKNYQKMDNSLAESSAEAVSKAFKTKDGFSYRLKTNKDGGRGLTFVFPEIISVKKWEFPNYEGIHINNQRNYRNQVEICLYCPLVETRDFFIRLLVQLFEVVRACGSVEEQVTLIIDWLEEKAGLFQEVKNRRWTSEKEKGLIGELHSLGWLYGYIGDWRRVLEAWKGSFSSPHDFEFSSLHIETKTIQKDGSVSFHGAYQTHCPVPTFLHAIQLEKGYGFTLLEKISALERGMKAGEIEVFRECLHKVGFDRKHHGGQERYNVSLNEFYLMSHSDFPSSIIDPLYHGITFKLNLRHIAFAKVKSSDVQRYLKKIESPNVS